MERRYETKYYHGLQIKIKIKYYPDPNQRFFFFDCYSNGVMIGYCHLMYDHKRRKITVNDLLIEEPYRGKGHGSKLWEFVEKYIKRGYKPSEFFGDISEVDDFNLASSFWRKVGFKIDGDRIFKSN